MRNASVRMTFTNYQLRVSQVVSENNITLADICYKPLSPQNNNCTIMTVWNYFQNNRDNLEATADGGINYLDHFKFCSRNTAAPKDSTGLGMPCMGEFGGPVDPSVALGGFLKPGTFFRNLCLLFNAVK